MNLTTEAKALIGIGIASIVLLIGGIFMVSAGSNPKSTAKAVDTTILVKNDSNKIASPNAKVTIVEFGDFQCPACKAANPVVKQTLAKYPGQVTFVFRNYPLSGHNHAKLAAEAAEAAGAQGKYWEMHHMLYDTQTGWSELKNPLDDAFVHYAKTIGIDVTKFKDSVEKSTFKDKIQNDINDGNRVGVQATPTFFVNGVKINGVTELTSAIDSALKNN